MSTPSRCEWEVWQHQLRLYLFVRMRMHCVNWAGWRILRHQRRWKRNIVAPTASSVVLDLGAEPKAIDKSSAMSNARCYAVMPGPRPLPIIGNSWRFAIGKNPWKTRALDVSLWFLRALAGDGGAAKVSKLFGHPDLVFPFCAEETARIYRREDLMPHRAKAPCLSHYKQNLRKDFFGDEPGLIGV